MKFQFIATKKKQLFDCLNEAIFTSKRSSYKKQNVNVLLGMDIVRLTLERAKTARHTLDILTKLHETYDQGGNVSFTPFIIIMRT